MSNPVIEILKARRATRAILPDPLPDPVVEELIEAARMAPSCRNMQPWRYIFMTTPEGLASGREVLAEGNRVWADRAPLLILAHTRAEDDCTIKDGREYHQFDLGMSVMNIMMAATHHGLTARPMAGFSPRKAREAFDLDEDRQPLVMLAVGRPGEDESHLPDHYKGIEGKRERRHASEIVRRI